MVNKTISIPQEIDLKLKQEENASALITRLLEKHYEAYFPLTAANLAKKSIELTERATILQEEIKLTEEERIKRENKEKTEKEIETIEKAKKEARDAATEALRASILAEIKEQELDEKAQESRRKDAL